VVFTHSRHPGNEKDPEQLATASPGPIHLLGSGGRAKARLPLRKYSNSSGFLKVPSVAGLVREEGHALPP
jgi:hypothetical protein